MAILALSAVVGVAAGASFLALDNRKANQQKEADLQQQLNQKVEALRAKNLAKQNKCLKENVFKAFKNYTAKQKDLGKDLQGFTIDSNQIIHRFVYNPDRFISKPRGSHRTHSRL